MQHFIVREWFRPMYIVMFKNYKAGGIVISLLLYSVPGMMYFRFVILDFEGNRWIRCHGFV